MPVENRRSDAGRTNRRRFLAWTGTVAAVGLAPTLSAGTLGSEPGESGANATDSPTNETGPTSSGTEGTTADASTEADASVARLPTLGGNLNGRPRRLNDVDDLLDLSGTTWVRAFLDVRQQLAAATNPSTDPDVVALRRAVREHGCKLIVSLKWDFVGSPWTDTTPMRVPDPGSDLETALFERATESLRAIGEPVDVVVLGNEPMWETPAADLAGPVPPVLRFMRRAKAHLVDHGDHGRPTYLVGAFNQIGRNVSARNAPLAAGLLEWARTDDDVSGIDLHVHFEGFSKAEGMVADARRALPDGRIAVTEFSPVWRYKRHVGEPIGTSDAGRAFCATYGYDPVTTGLEYFADAKRHPRTPDELGAFYEAMPWYDTDHVARMHDLFAAHGVEWACLGFLQDRGMRAVDWGHDWSPYQINALFQQALLDAPGPHPTYFDDYRRWA